MSRIGKLPVSLPSGVSVELLDGNVLKVKGPLGQMCQKVDPDIKVTIEDNQIKFERPTDQPRHRSMHGLYRALVHNMVVGVSEGFTTQQELVGVGYRVSVQGQLLTFSLGYSHEIQLMLPEEVKAEIPDVRKGENPRLVLKSCDKQLVGQVAAKVRSFRRPEPYKGKGIKFVGEQLRRKAGKTASAK
ncbi:MAG: 50S ribosomal protein L6 [Bacteroidales bacterium]|nr:50S ribosomal protein L6 [Bacteroidales bacterium]MBR0084489.1 50S ribosomal protein L6 [Bacteroidales bacterium]MBR0291307.1 50S ribosomal protein L6 [Bacteroidales bacterium]